MADLERHTIWQYTPSGTADVCVKPVTRVPADRLVNRLVASRVTLGNGQRRWALFGSVTADQPRLNQHLMSIGILGNDAWFHLARYYEFDRETRSPQALAEFLGLKIVDVFPISYDLRESVRGTAEALVGTMLAEPVERLTREQIFELGLHHARVAREEATRRGL